MNLTLAQLMAVGKSKVSLTKQQRKGLIDTSSELSADRQLQALGEHQAKVNQLRDKRNKEKNHIETLELQKHRRMLAKERGTLSDLLDIHKNTPSTIEQSFFSANRKKEITDRELKNKEKSDRLERNIKHYMDSPSAEHWHKSLSDKLQNEVRFETAVGNENGRSHMTEMMARGATLEAIRRHAKKEGIESDYQSAKSSHAGGSHYFKNNAGEIVRVSDHELPDTPQRQMNRTSGFSGRWNDEVVLHDWKNRSVPDYIHRIKTGKFPGEED